jgi:hypothetical protein
MTEARGSVVLEDTVAVMEHFKPAKGNEFRELSWSKSRYAPPQPTMRMSWDPQTWRLALVSEDAVSAQVLALMNDSPLALYTVSELCEELEETQAKVRAALSHLLDDERIVKRKASGQAGWVYRLKSDGDSDEGGLSVV